LTQSYHVHLGAAGKIPSFTEDTCVDRLAKRKFSGEELLRPEKKVMMVSFRLTSRCLANIRIAVLTVNY
jgi:hypothetical protein